MSKPSELIYCEVASENKDQGNVVYCDTELYGEESDLASRRLLGSLHVQEGKITAFDRDVERNLNVRHGQLFTTLFADTPVGPMKMFLLNKTGACQVRLRDSSGLLFWAEIRKEGNVVRIRDIDQEKKFAIDGEDLMDEMDRQPNIKFAHNFS